ncbi:MAG: glycosyltransferase family 4 protein [Promethearchaeota archaeon]
MLVIQITAGYFTHGAVMRRARQETRALLKAGHEVIAITDLRYKSSIHELDDFKDRLQVIPLKPIYFYPPFRKISSELSFTIKLYFALKRIAQTRKIDIITCHMSTLCLAVARISKKYKITNTWVIQDYIKDRMATGNPYNWLETLMLLYTDKHNLRKINYIIPVSKYIKKLTLLDGADPERTIIKYNTIDTNLFTPNPPQKKDIDILFIGRLSIEKGVNILIKASKYLSHQKKIVIIGEGPLRNYLEALAKKIDNQIIFKGFIDHDLLPSYIRRAKLLVAPSLSECHAAVPLEAMACGVPVIASNVAGMTDTIQHGKNGWILKKNTPKELATFVEQVLSDEKYLEKIGNAAVKRAELFSETRFEKEIVKFYENLIKNA